MATAVGSHGRPFEARSLQDVHKAMLTFFRWAEEEGYPVDSRLTRIKRPKAPEKEPTVFHIRQLREILAACSPDRPVEELMIKILVGSGVREAELMGLAIAGPDGLPDLMTDSISSGRAELRVRWDGGAKGKKTRRVPITPKLAAAIKRYEARYRPQTGSGFLLLNKFGLPFRKYGIVSFMDRLQVRVGFRVYAHAFRHTFATVATKMGWNFEHLRAAMGHSDYKVLQGYVRVATERDLGRRQDWEELIVPDPARDRW
jgi:integrase